MSYGGHYFRVAKNMVGDEGLSDFARAQFPSQARRGELLALIDSVGEPFPAKMRIPLFRAKGEGDRKGRSCPPSLYFR